MEQNYSVSQKIPPTLRGPDIFHVFHKWLRIFNRFLPARRYASAGYRDRNVSVCPFVRPSVRPSVTRRYCVKTKKASSMISSPSDSPKTLVF